MPTDVNEARMTGGPAKLKVVVALGGNALLRRDQPPTADNQLENNPWRQRHRS